MAGIADTFEARTALRLALEEAARVYASKADEAPHLAAELAAAMLREHARHLEDESMRQ